MAEPSKSTLKALGAVSGNRCAYPGCLAPIYDTEHSKLVGQVAHIKAESPLGPRYDKNQSDAERHGFGNLMFMCVPHHLVIDDQANLSEYTVEALLAMKLEHEARSRNTTMTEDVLERLVQKVLDLQAQRAPVPSLVPVIESMAVNMDNQVAIDTYDFRVGLHNDGDVTIREFRVEVEIPTEFKPPKAGINKAEVRSHNRGDVRLFMTTEQHWPGLVLYSGHMTGHLLLLDYELPVHRYVAITGDEVIRVKVFAGDVCTHTMDYRIADYLSEDRCSALWATNDRRPVALRHPRRLFD